MSPFFLLALKSSIFPVFLSILTQTRGSEIRSWLINAWLVERAFELKILQPVSEFVLSIKPLRLERTLGFRVFDVRWPVANSGSTAWRSNRTPSNGVQPTELTTQSLSLL